jgi:hypothetical protein
MRTRNMLIAATAFEFDQRRQRLRFVAGRHPNACGSAAVAVDCNMVSGLASLPAHTQP